MTQNSRVARNDVTQSSQGLRPKGDRRRVQSTKNSVEDGIESSVKSSGAVEFFRDGVDLARFRRPGKERDERRSAFSSLLRRAERQRTIYSLSTEHIPTPPVLP